MSDAPGLASRKAAQAILIDVLHRRRPLDLASAPADPLPARDAGFARALARETLRRFGQLDQLVRTFTKLPPPHRAGPTFEILLAGACELLFLKVPPHAVVDAANRLAQADQKAVHFKPLINAVLRRISREGASVVEGQDAARLNTPDWLWTRWESAYGETTARAIATAHLSPAPVDIVVKDTQARDDHLPKGEWMFERVRRLSETTRVDQLPGFHGSWWVQDAAASLPARLFGDVRGQTVLDLCAAPGGKTMQLAAAGANVTAVEREAARLALVQENLERMNLTATVVNADMRDLALAPAPFVLLDAPCTATGTVRRHPELPWIKSAADVTQCAAAEGELLDKAADLTAKGGLLVYAVCSLEPEEGKEQIDDFLGRNETFVREPIAPDSAFQQAWISADGDLRTLPCHLADKGGMDGFYAARLRRK